MTDFVQLQLRMKRDPPGYREDFLQQCRFFMSNLQIFKLQPFAKAGKSLAETATIFNTNTKAQEKPSQRSAHSGLSQAPVQSRRVEEFCALIAFISFTSHLYPEEVRKLQIPRELFSLLFNNCEALDPFLRKTLVQALVLFQDKNLITRIELLPALFRCFRCADKELRESVFNHIVSDIQKLQKTNPSVQMTTALQKLVFSMMKEDHPGVALKAMYVLVELWKRKTWVNDKVVNSLASMCFSKNDKLTSAGLYFFLGDYDTRDEEEEELRQTTLAKAKEIQTVRISLKHIKKRMKKQREIERNQKAIRRAEKELENDDDDEEGHLPTAHINPLNMLYDAQHFAERLFYKLKTSRETFHTRMLMMNVLSKLIGLHKLLLFNFFPFVQRYLTPSQRHVTALLTYVARATHPLVPPEVLQPVIKTIANHFVTDRSTPEVIAVGINAVREICVRSPLVMTETLLHDLTEYSRHKNKSIMSATRSLMQVFRELNPALLKRKDRGREAQMKLSVMKHGGEEGETLFQDQEFKLQYGAERVSRDVDGVDLLEKVLQAEAEKKRRRNGEDDEWTEDIGDFDPDEYLQDDNDSDDEERKNKPKIFLLSKFERKKLRKNRGKVLKQLRRKIYAANGLDDESDQVDEDGMDLIEKELAKYEDIDGKDGDDNNDADDEDDDDDEDMEEIDMDTFLQDDEDQEEMNEDDFDALLAEGEMMDEGEDEDDMEQDMEMDDEDMEVENDDDDDEEEQANKKSKSNVPNIEDKIVKLADVPASVPKAAIRILTPADFKKIELLKQRRLEEGIRGIRKRQKGNVLEEDLYDQYEKLTSYRSGSFVDVDEEELGTTHAKKRKLAREERIARQQEGREILKEARRVAKYGHEIKSDNGGKSNVEQLKTKNFVMVKHSKRVRAKAMAGFQDKQKKLSSHISTLKNMGKNLKRGIAKKARSKKKK